MEYFAHNTVEFEHASGAWYEVDFDLDRSGDAVVVAVTVIDDEHARRGDRVTDPAIIETARREANRALDRWRERDACMTQAELNEALATFRTVLPPPGITTMLNGREIPARHPIARAEATLATEIADAHGFLRPTKRATVIEIFEPQVGETAALYEMGIPVVETGDRYHVNVLQKVPLNADRDNVPPAFLRDVRALVLNEMATDLTGEQEPSG